MDWNLCVLCIIVIVTEVNGGDLDAVARLHRVSFEAFDTVVTALARSPYRHQLPVKAPYHKMFAMSNHELLQIDPIKFKLSHFYYWGSAKISILRLSATKFPIKFLFAEARKPDPKKNPIGAPGAILARRLAGLKVPYHPLYCNCYHYSDYFTYGTTFGTPTVRAFWQLNPYLPIGDDCPLHDTIDADTDVMAEDFRLRAKNGKSIKLQPPPIMGVKMPSHNVNSKRTTHRKADPKVPPDDGRLWVSKLPAWFRSSNNPDAMNILEQIRQIQAKYLPSTASNPNPNIT